MGWETIIAKIHIYSLGQDQIYQIIFVKYLDLKGMDKNIQSPRIVSVLRQSRPHTVHALHPCLQVPWVWTLFDNPQYHF